VQTCAKWGLNCIALTAIQLRELLMARHPMRQHYALEERYGIQVIRDVALDAGLNVRLWSVTTACVMA
jgi:hypothetical protein